MEQVEGFDPTTLPGLPPPLTERDLDPFKVPKVGLFISEVSSALCSCVGRTWTSHTRRGCSAPGPLSHSILVRHVLACPLCHTLFDLAPAPALSSLADTNSFSLVCSSPPSHLPSIPRSKTPEASPLSAWSYSSHGRELPLFLSSLSDCCSRGCSTPEQYLRTGQLRIRCRTHRTRSYNTSGRRLELTRPSDSSGSV